MSLFWATSLEGVINLTFCIEFESKKKIVAYENGDSEQVQWIKNWLKIWS